MSNTRVFEFTVGDPKSNQQTASNATCNVTINTTPSNPNLPPINLSNHPSDTPESEPTTPDTTAVNVPVHQEAITRQLSAQRYIQTSPTIEVTPDEIRAKLSFYRKLHEVENKLTRITRDSYNHLIVSAEDLIQIISAMLSNDVIRIEHDDIKLKLSGTESETGCFCTKRSTTNGSLFEVLSIKISGRDFGTAYNEAYNMLGDEFGISVERVF